MKTEIYKLSAMELSKAYENKALSPLEVTNSIIDRIKDIDDKVNAYVFSLAARTSTTVVSRG